MMLIHAEGKAGSGYSVSCISSSEKIGNTKLLIEIIPPPSRVFIKPEIRTALKNDTGMTAK